MTALVAAPTDRSRRRRAADVVEHGDRYARAGRFHAVPVMPAWSQVPVLGESPAFQVIGPGVGKLRMQLLQGGFAVVLRIQPVEVP